MISAGGTGKLLKRSNTAFSFCRYYRLIEESIDPCMVSPLSAEWLQGIYSYIPAELCKVWSKSLQDLTKVCMDLCHALQAALIAINT